MITRSIVLTALALLGFTSTAAAHIVLVEPKPRVPDASGLKGGPCGKPAAVWGANGTTTFAPGQQITIKVLETVTHQGAFRVAMDMDGENDFTPMVSLDTFNKYVAYFNGALPLDQLPAEVVGPVAEGNMIVLRDFFGIHPGGDCPSNSMETINGNTGCVWSTQVTLPNQTCENCTLQVIQMMSDVGHGYDGGFYYHCADIKIAGPVANGAGGAGNTGGSSASTGGASTSVGGNASGGLASSPGGTANSTGGKNTGGNGVSPSGTGGAKTAATGGALATGNVSQQGAATEQDSGCGVAGGSSSKWAWLAPLGLGALLARRMRLKKIWS